MKCCICEQEVKEETLEERNGRLKRLYAMKRKKKSHEIKKLCQDIKSKINSIEVIAEGVIDDDSLIHNDNVDDLRQLDYWFYGLFNELGRSKMEVLYDSD